MVQEFRRVAQGEVCALHITYTSYIYTLHILRILLNDKSEQHMYQTKHI